MKIHRYRYPHTGRRCVQETDPSQPGLAHNRPGTGVESFSDQNHRNFGQQRLGDISMYHEADEKRGLPLAFLRPLRPLLFSPSTSFSLRRLFKPSAGLPPSRARFHVERLCTKENVKISSRLAHSCTHHPRYAMFADVQPKRPALSVNRIRLNIVHPRPLSKKFSIFLGDPCAGWWTWVKIVN